MDHPAEQVIAAALDAEAREAVLGWIRGICLDPRSPRFRQPCSFVWLASRKLEVPHGGLNWFATDLQPTMWSCATRLCKPRRSGVIRVFVRFLKPLRASPVA